MIFNLKYKLPDKVGSLDLAVESCLDLTEESQISSNSAARARTPRCIGLCGRFV